MKTEPFLDSFRDINKRFVDLIDVLSALSGLSSLELETDHEEILLKSALRTLTENVDLERCSVFLLDNNNLKCAAGLDWYELTSKESDSAERNIPMVFKVGEGIIGQAVLNNKLILVSDCSSDKRVTPVRKKDGSEKLLMGSLISVPIHAGNRILGVLNVSHPDTHHFNETHERLLTLFSNFLGQILENWRHVHKMQDMVNAQTVQLEHALAEAKLLKERYQELSIIDELTGLHNRRFFFPEVESALSRTVRYGHDFSLIVVDIDRFKEINDSLGHLAGDSVLIEITKIIKGQMRTADIACRFGGEEFMIALPDTKSDEAVFYATRLHQLVQETVFEYERKPFNVTLTMGITDIENINEMNAGQKDVSLLLEEMIKQADRAMYFGKENGRNQTRVFKDIVCKI